MPNYRRLTGQTLFSSTPCPSCGGPGTGAGYYATYCDNPGSYIFISSVSGCQGNQPVILSAPFNNLNVGNVVKIKTINCNGAEYCVQITSIVNDNFQGYTEGYIDLDLNPSFAAFADCPTCDSSTLGGNSGSGGSTGGGGGNGGGGGGGGGGSEGDPNIGEQNTL